MDFSTLANSDITPMSLAERIRAAKLPQTTREVLRVLLQGGEYYGFVVRRSSDSDSNGSALAYRMEYERGVVEIVSRLAGDVKDLAKDLALIAYHEARASGSQLPDSLRKVSRALRSG